MKQALHALYGLKWNPFSQEVPTESLYIPSPVEQFIWRIEHAHVQEGGFALVVGDPGTGKSCLLRLLAEKLNQVPGLTVGTFTHPQSSVLNELRLLNAHQYDSRNLLTVILVANDSLVERFRSTRSLLPLGSRIRKRLQMEAAFSEQLQECLRHLLEKAGNAMLMSDTLIHTICDHSVGNYRIMTTLANELLEEACRQQLSHLDEKLYFEVFAPSTKKSPLSKPKGR